MSIWLRQMGRKGASAISPDSRLYFSILKSGMMHVTFVPLVISTLGAAPKVEMARGTKVTNIIPDFRMEKYTGFVGEIVDAPFRPICRSQIDVAYKCPDEKVALNMPGFHWMTWYGDHIRETGYALKKIGIGWENLG